MLVTGVGYYSFTCQVIEWQNKEESFLYSRETCNFVGKIHKLIQNGGVAKKYERWVFIDNFVFDSCYSKGPASTKWSHELITWMWNIEMYGLLFTHVIWVSGTRLIVQGMDGLSYGYYTSGVLITGDFISPPNWFKCKWTVCRHQRIIERISSWKFLEGIEVKQMVHGSIWSH